MPQDPKSVRTPSFRAKLSSIRGLSGEEKALLQRVGNLIDTFTIAQKQTSNPRGQRRKVKATVPRPTNVQINTITGGVNVTWDEVDIPELDFYEIQFSESATFAENNSFTVLGNRMSFRASPASGSLFVRLRTVTKRGDASLFTNTISLTVSGASIFSTDQDQIDPENRTTVSPKPTLVGTALTSETDNHAFVGIGAYVGPSPLLFSDDDQLKSNTNIRHEVTYTIHENTEPYPGIEQRLAPTIGEFIDVDDFYTFSPSFYCRFAVMPRNITDFFKDITITQDPSELDIEFLRYRIVETFYEPNFNQAGIVFSASMANIRS